MRMQSHVLYRMALIAALGIIVLSGRPDSGIHAAALASSTDLGSTAIHHFSSCR